MKPLECIERELAELKALPDIVRRAAKPAGEVHMGPWAALHKHTKDLLLGYLDWSGVDPADRQRIMEREVDYEVIHADLFYPFRRHPQVTR
jgi:hypothetical protein